MLTTDFFLKRHIAKYNGTALSFNLKSLVIGM
jgi:hypothetical protein